MAIEMGACSTKLATKSGSLKYEKIETRGGTSKEDYLMEAAESLTEPTTSSLYCETATPAETPNLDSPSKSTTKRRKSAESPADTLLFNAITCAFLALSFLASLVVTDLGTILAVVGATGSTMVSYVLPGSIYIKLHPEYTFVKGLAYLQLTIGCIIIPTALFFVLFYGAAG
jgi:hypothetical protein